MKKILKVAGVIALLLLVGIGGMLFYLTRGLAEGADLSIGEIDLTQVANGTYSGRYEGGRWTNEVAVFVQNQQITDIQLIEDVRFVQEEVSKQLFDAVIQEQSIKIDTVSEATVTSKAYLKAIENALK